MCGIVVYVGNRKCKSILINGLKRLEYRGYDSAGIAIMSGDFGRKGSTLDPIINIAKEAGKSATRVCKDK
jgi:glucosamine 6-phosphate synthetase-like amidotransferase/phosphosugar isomerase protein